MDRKLEVLVAVVDEYIKTGEPVGSKAVMYALGGNISSATIRNDMAALCDIGLLSQPHVSAGRIPTVKGYRIYINLLSQQNLQEKKLEKNPPDKTRIDKAVKVIAKSASKTKEAAQALSDLTGYATLTARQTSSDPIACFQVIPHSARIYSVLIATASGNIKSLAVNTQTPVSKEEMEFFIKTANSHFKGKPASSVTVAAVQELAVKLISGFMAFAPFLGALREIAEELSQSELNISGEEQLFTNPDMEPKTVREMISLFSNKSLLLKVLGNGLDIPPKNQVAVVLGHENPITQLSESAVLTAQYKAGAKTFGKLGVIAPIRIDYRNIIPQIEYFTRKIEEILNNSNTDADMEEDDGNQ